MKKKIEPHSIRKGCNKREYRGDERGWDQGETYLTAGKPRLGLSENLYGHSLDWETFLTIHRQIETKLERGEGDAMKTVLIVNDS